MKRNYELLRTIMQDLEASLRPGETEKLDFNRCPKLLPHAGNDFPVIMEHTRLLVSEGFLDGTTMKSGNPKEPTLIMLIGISMKGHDFIAESADEKVFGEALAKAGNASLSVFLQVLGTLASAAILR